MLDHGTAATRKLFGTRRSTHAMPGNNTGTGITEVVSEQSALNRLCNPLVPRPSCSVPNLQRGNN